MRRGAAGLELDMVEPLVTTRAVAVVSAVDDVIVFSTTVS